MSGSLSTHPTMVDVTIIAKGENEMKLYFFNTGVLRVDKASVTLGRGAGTVIDIPVPFYLIQHPKGNLLFDTGNAKELAVDADNYVGIGAKYWKPIMEPEEYCIDQLAKIGIKPEDIKYVAMSHLHWDHAGGLREFPKAKILVQRREVEWAYTVDWWQKGAYLRADFDHKLKYEYIEGWEENPYDVFGDGSVQLLLAPGHTPGHQMLKVNLPKSGTFLLTGDAIYHNEVLNKSILPGQVWNAQETVKTIKKIRHMRDNGVTIVPGHDPEAWQEYKKAPEYYE